MAGRVTFLLVVLSWLFYLGSSQIATTFVKVGDNYLFRTNGPENPGLNYALYNGFWGALPNFASLSPTKTGTINNLNLVELVPNGHYFGVVFTGFIYIEESGTITLRLGSDDGSKLFIDGALIINNDGLHAHSEVEGSVFLTKGYHAIRVEFFERDGAYSLELKWKIAPFQIIVSPAALVSSNFNGGFAELKVKLSRKPAGNVTVIITNPSSTVVLSACALYFDASNYDKDQSVAVIPVSGFGPKTSFSIEFKGESQDTNYNNKITQVPVGQGSSSSAKCVSWGDPHFTTFDGRVHNFQGVGDFYLTRTLDANVVIQTRQRVCGAKAPSVTCNFGIAIKYQNSVIVLSIDAAGTPSLQARSALDPAIKLQITGNTYLFTLPEGTIVEATVGYWGGPGVYYLNIYITAATYQKNRVKGLCGDFDGNSANDFAPANNEQSFGANCLAPPSESIFNWPNTELPVYPDPQAPPPSDFEFNGTPLSCNPNWSGPTPPPGGSDGSDILDDLPITPPDDNEGTPPPFVYVPPEWSSPEFQDEAEELCNELFFTGESAVLCNQILGETNTAQGFYDHCIFDAKATDSLEFASDAVAAYLSLCKDEAESVGNDDVKNLCPNLCSLKGNCTTGSVCVCIPGWGGPDCSQEVGVPTLETIGNPNVECFPLQGSITIRGKFFTSDLSWECVFNGGATSPVRFISNFELACKIPASFGPDSYFSVSIPSESDTLSFNSYTCPQSGSTPAPKTDPPTPPPPACTSKYCSSTFEFQGEEYSFDDFNVVSYSNFKVKTGDVEGRVLVRKDFQASAGYSIGALLETQEDYSEKSFSLIALGDVNWGNGALLPPSSHLFAGLTFSSDSPFGIAEQRSGGNCSYCETSPCCDSVVEALQGHYECSSAQSKALLTPPNYRAVTSYSIKYNGIFVSCTKDSYRYVLNIDASDFNSATWYNLDKCLSDASWTININAKAGTKVEFNGDWFPARNGKVTYNVYYNDALVEDSTIGECLGEIHVKTDVNGNILAPHSSLLQTGGLVRGWVVACAYSANDAMQVNIPCDDSILTTLEYKGYAISVDPKKKDSVTLNSASGSNVQVGDVLTLCPDCENEEQVTILSIDGNSFQVTSPTSSHKGVFFTTQFTPGRVFDVPFAGEGPTGTPKKQESSSSFLSFNFIILGLVLVLLAN